MSTPPEPRSMRVRDAVRDLSRRLRATGQEDARTVSEYAVAHLLGFRRLEVYLNPDSFLSTAQVETFIRMGDRLAHHEPLQYVLGYAEFMGRRFHVDPRALIPRPETEDLVGAALLHFRSGNNLPRLVDVGTGSGIIAISLALSMPDALLWAIDLDGEALALARENARLHGVENRIQWRHADLLAEFSPKSMDGIVANMPYVSTGEMDRLDARVRNYEPRVALDGGPEGTSLIERLTEQAMAVLRPGGFLLMEIGEEQGPAVHALLRARGWEEEAILKDCAGHDRIVRARKTANLVRPRREGAPPAVLGRQSRP